MVKVRFKQDRVVQDSLAGTAHETRFAAGEVVDLAEASANHWLARGVAERVAETHEPASPPAETSAPGDDLFSREGGAAEPDGGEPDREDAESEAAAEAVADGDAPEPNGGKPKRGAAKAARA